MKTEDSLMRVLFLVLFVIILIWGIVQDADTEIIKDGQKNLSEKLGQLERFMMYEHFGYPDSIKTVAFRINPIYSIDNVIIINSETGDTLVGVRKQIIGEEKWQRN